MSKKKKQFSPHIYAEWGELFDAISIEERAELLLAITKFPEYEPKNVTIWNFIKSQIQKDYEIFLDKCESNSLIIKNYWTKRKQKKDTNENECIPKRITNNELRITKTDNKEKEKLKKEKEISDSFASFYEAYPLKKSKSNALRAYKKAILAAEPSAIMNGLQRYIEEIKVKKTEKQYIKHPATWLNQKCWEDEYLVSNKETAKIKPYNPYYNAEADNLKVLQGEQKQVKYNPYYNAFAEGNYA